MTKFRVTDHSRAKCSGWLPFDFHPAFRQLRILRNKSCCQLTCYYLQLTLISHGNITSADLKTNAKNICTHKYESVMSEYHTLVMEV